MVRDFIKRLGVYFPERQIYFRANGLVRFVVVSPRLQVGMLSVAMLALMWVGVTSVTYLTRDLVMEQKDVTIEEMQSAFSKVTNDMRSLQFEVIERARRLEERQSYLENLADADPSGKLSLPGPAPLEEDPEETAPAGGEPPLPNTPPSDSGQFDKPMAVMGLSLFVDAPAAAPGPEQILAEIAAFRAAIAGRYQALETNQLRLAKKLNRFAQTQLAYLEQQLQGTGLEVKDLTGLWDGGVSDPAAGGPYIPVIPEPVELAGADSRVVSVFLELANTWSDLQKSHDALRSMPSAEPAEEYYVSSRFGRRRDPLRKVSAIHHGLDMAGWPGTRILASAAGIVARSGKWGPYGNMIEIDHGNGFMTRYGHLRRIGVKKGDILRRGQTIGEMGCTGRCTSTHLHYEVWYGGKVRNPLPYIKVAKNVYKIQKRTNERYNASE